MKRLVQGEGFGVERGFAGGLFVNREEVFGGGMLHEEGNWNLQRELREIYKGYMSGNPLLYIYKSAFFCYINVILTPDPSPT